MPSAPDVELDRLEHRRAIACVDAGCQLRVGRRRENESQKRGAGCA
jgi:hypothetical protein